MNFDERIIVALDVQSEKRLDFLIEELSGVAKFVKVGMELYYTYGPQIIKRLKDKGFKVFLDLKIHDIPNTAKSSCKTITKLGADIINVHASGGAEMLRASVAGVDEAIAEDSRIKRPLLIGVTQLTSTDQSMLQEDLLINESLPKVVTHLAELSKRSGLDGIVSSPLEVQAVKDATGSEFICVTPGIRPKSTDKGDQKRVTTPKDASDGGSDYIVIGRAITQAQSPRSAYLNILKDL